MVDCGVLTGGVTLVCGVGAFTVAQTFPISYDSPVTLAILIAVAGAAFTVGTLLTGIRRDIKEIRWQLRHLPCEKRLDKKCDFDSKG